MKYDSRLSCMESLGRWDELVDSYITTRLWMVDAASMRQVEQQILCPYCSKKGHAKKDCWKWQRERGGKGDSKANPKVMVKEKMGSTARGKEMKERKSKDDGKEKKKIVSYRAEPLENLLG